MHLNAAYGACSSLVSSTPSRISMLCTQGQHCYCKSPMHLDCWRQRFQLWTLLHVVLKLATLTALNTFQELFTVCWLWRKLMMSQSLLKGVTSIFFRLLWCIETTALNGHKHLDKMGTQYTETILSVTSQKSLLKGVTTFKIHSLCRLTQPLNPY